MVIKIGVLELQGGYALREIESSNKPRGSTLLSSTSLLIRISPAQVPKTGLCLENLIIDSFRLYFFIRSERVVDSPPGIIKPSDCFKSSLDLTGKEFNPIFLRRL